MKKVAWAFLMIIDVEGNEDNEEFIEMLTKILNTAKICNADNNVHVSLCLRCNIQFAKQLLPQVTNLTFNGLANPLLLFKNGFDQFTIESIDITNSAGINTIINNFWKTDLEAAKYGLITWGHGAVYSFFPKDNKEPEPVVVSGNLKMNYDTETFNFYYKNFDKDLSPRYLQVDELATGIVNGHGQKLDLMVMAHCTMGCFEAARKMRTCTRYWLAPIANHEYNSIKYDSIFNDLNKGKITSFETTEVLKKFLPVKIDNETKEELRDFVISSMLAFDLKYFDLLKDYFYLLIKQLLRELYINKRVDRIGNSMANISTFGADKYCQINLFIFVKNLQQEFPNFYRIRRYSDELTRISEKIIVPVNDSDGGCALNIFFPRTKEIFLDIKNETADIINIADVNEKVLRPKWEYFVFKYFSL